ncbi:glycerophosphodiester phosphodiesterase family protein [Sphingobacterium sp. LRF_L2]|uniref:glycerophosphodiester phosphodiesterase family protein n=1 Tax=Sphingobacterium sp. LRF_L2 TaxID=3369421 RepID=UPI003F62602A
MRRLIGYSLSWIFVNLVGLSDVNAQSQLLLDKLNKNERHVAAHRGAHIDYPENSIASIQEAIRLGVSIVEVDVRSTKDGVLVLMHDNTVDRTTTGKGKISELTFEEVQALSLRKEPHGEISEHRIPTLNEVLLFCKGKCIIDLDFKEEKEEYIHPTFELIEKVGMEDEVLFFLYDHRDMERVHRINPSITLFPRARSMKDLHEILKTNLTKIIHIDESFRDHERLLKLKSQGVYFWMNSLGDFDEKAELEGEKVYKAFLMAYPFVNIIQTDHPALWNQTLISYKN